MVEIFYLPEFLKQAKKLAKKYPSFPEDLRTFLCEIKDNPLAGVDLGEGIKKVRMAIKSKGKGKSGGARVITFNIAFNSDHNSITLLTIYDKSNRETISDNEIIALKKKVDNES